MRAGRHVWRTGLCLLGLVTLASCDALLPPEIKDCERFVIGKLRAPTTYHRVEAHKTLMDDLKPPEIWVSIEYDAANAYGTPIRDRQICQYPLVNGRADLSKHIDHDALPLAEDVSMPEKAMNAMDAVAAEADKPTTSNRADPSSKKLASPLDKDSEPSSNVASGSEPVPKADLCWEGYCPCDAPQGGGDQLLCDQLRMGKRDAELLSVGKSMRDVRRQIRESEF